MEAHCVVAAKSLEVVTPEIVIAFKPLLVIVIVWAELVDPTDWFAKVKLAGEMVAVVT